MDEPEFIPTDTHEPYTLRIYLNWKRNYLSMVDKLDKHTQTIDMGAGPTRSHISKLIHTNTQTHPDKLRTMDPFTSRNTQMDTANIPQRSRKRNYRMGKPTSFRMWNRLA